MIEAAGGVVWRRGSDGRTAPVRCWAREPLAGAFPPDDEVDEVRRVARAGARLLSREWDVELVAGRRAPALV